MILISFVLMEVQCDVGLFGRRIVLAYFLSVQKAVMFILFFFYNLLNPTHYRKAGTLQMCLNTHNKTKSNCNALYSFLRYIFRVMWETMC